MAYTIQLDNSRKPLKNVKKSHQRMKPCQNQLVYPQKHFPFRTVN